MPSRWRSDGSLCDGDYDVQLTRRNVNTVQTHNAVSVAASGFSVQASWVDCNGYDQIAVTLLNDAATSSTLSIHWSNDGVTQHGDESFLTSATSQRRQGITPTKARYVRLALGNADTASHTMSAWAYLKA